jgi:exo-1,4-beta-D-glucosaminidase
MFSRAFAASILFSLLGATMMVADAMPSAATPLQVGWQVQSGCKLKVQGESIASPEFKPEGWYPTTVPSTVVSTLVANGAIPNPYYGDNLRKIPGTDYPVGKNFSRLPMSDDSPYRCAWWYRKEFTIPAADHGQTLWLRFSGINYRANIWLNGQRIADSTQVAGAYRTYELDITRQAKLGKVNVLAVEAVAPTETDLGINWVDWNPCPPDKDMGLWGAVDLVTSGPVSVRSPMVTTHLPTGSSGAADLRVYAELYNSADHPVHGEAIAEVGGINVKQMVDLASGEKKTLLFTPKDYPALHVEHPQLWWPYQMGTPHLENLTVRFSTDGKLSDEQSVRFGIREMTSELTEKGFRLFRVNGKPILVRGAGWSQDMLLQEKPEHLVDQFRLVRDMHLNTIRLEGKMETEQFFHLADEQGILVMLGWCCCDQWEQWSKWTPENLSVAKESLRSQMLRVRSHASLLVWLNGSDNPPPADVERAYLDIEAETHWPNPTLSSASRTSTTVTGESGVKMSGPYDYVAPSYWLVDTGRFGGAYGFNTETGPGPAIPTISSLHHFLPGNHMWPPDDIWALHNGGGKFKTLDVFDTAMEATYGKPSDLKDYVRVAQTMAFNGERAMFEAYGRNKYTSTGVIQWMLNNAWPSMIWHLYDYYLDVGGGYFGAKKACEPIHIQYSYDDYSVAVVNSRYEEVPHLTASAKVYDFQLKELYSKETEVTLGADAAVRAFSIPEEIFRSDRQLVFVKLMLKNQAGEIVSENFYWVPTHLTEFDWSKTEFTHTPASKHEDLNMLRQLPAAEIKAEAQMVSDSALRVRLHNPSKALAFQVALAATDGDGQDVTPVLWSDNYVELLPGETRTFTAQVLNRHAVHVQVSGWNVQGQTLTPTPTKATVASR